jgi:hypothetical protein
VQDAKNALGRRVRKSVADSLIRVDFFHLACTLCLLASRGASKRGKGRLK